MINNDLNDNDDISRQIRSIYGAGNILIKKFKYCSEDVKDYLFKTYCTSMYGGHLCCKYNLTVLTIAKVAYKCISRKFRNPGKDTSISANMVAS